MKKKIEIPEILNDIENVVKFEEPYTVEVEIIGSCPILFHRWSCEDVEAKAKATKGSKEKRSDNLEAYIYRDNDGHICLPGQYVKNALVYAAKFKQDPRSPRKSAFDLFKAGIVPITELAKINGGTRDWDFIDKRRVVVHRNGITRLRPAFLSGWSAKVEFQIIAPEYIEFPLFSEVLELAGRLVGTGDFRPTYGRFTVGLCKKIDMDRPA